MENSPQLYRARVLVCALFAFALFTASGVHAIPVTEANFSPSATLINFDNLAGGSTIDTGEVVTTQYAGLGATFVNPDYVSRANTSIAAQITGQSDPNVLFIRQHDGNPFGRPQQIIFSSPVLRAGTFFSTSLNSTATIEAYSTGGALLESLTLTGAPQGTFLTGFIGLQRAEGIGRIELYSRSNAAGQPNFSFSIDDLRFEFIPEPSTALAGIAAAAINLRIRRSRRSASR
jgi:hypothetical protein